MFKNVQFDCIATSAVEYKSSFAQCPVTFFSDNNNCHLGSPIAVG